MTNYNFQSIQMASYQDDDLDFGITLDNGEATDRKLTEVTDSQKSVTLERILEYQKMQEQLQSQKQQKVNDQPLSLSLSKNDYSLSEAAHPIACIFTFLFKGLALFIYLIISPFISKVIVFISVTTFAAADFWVVKNISGRLLVGMRWWSTLDEKGNQKWVFQTLEKSQSLRKHINKVDKAFFWSTQIISTIFWGLLFLLKCLTLNFFWGLLVGINFGLSAMNLYGYYLCRGEKGKAQFSKLGKEIGLKGITKLASLR